MSAQPSSLLRVMFIIGATVDGVIAVSWFLIVSELQIPDILNGYVGASSGHQLSMYVAAKFMTGWTTLLVGGQ